MDFGAFQPDVEGIDLSSDFNIQHGDLSNLHSINTAFEAIAAGRTSIISDNMFSLQSAPQFNHISESSLNPFGTTFYGLGVQERASSKAVVMNNPVSMVPKVEPLVSYLPLEIKVSHLTESSSSGSKSFQLSSKCTQRKTAAGKVLKKAHVIKGKWAPEEDRELRKLVEQFGVRRWTHIAQMLTGRVGKQCRDRWHNHLRPNVKKDIWTEEEDMILIQAHKEVGNKWSEIARRLPGRTENSTKNHWNATKRRRFADRSRRTRNTSGKPKSCTLLQDYIRSLGPSPSKAIAPLPPTPALPLSSPLQVRPLQVKDQKMERNTANILPAQEIIFDMLDDAPCQTHSCEDLLDPTSNGFPIEMCDGKEELQHHGHSEGDVMSSTGCAVNDDHRTHNDVTMDDDMDEAFWSSLGSIAYTKPDQTCACGDAHTLSEEQHITE